jgi:hypothetical protein
MSVKIVRVVKLPYIFECSLIISLLFNWLILVHLMNLG